MSIIRYNVYLVHTQDIPRPGIDVGTAPRGTQTLVRGLAMLDFVAAAGDGVTVQQVADHTGAHRTIALRSLAALAEFNLVRKGHDGRFRVGAGVIALGRDYLPALRDAAGPLLVELADGLLCCTGLFVTDSDAAVAVTVVEPTGVPMHLTFKTGSRHPLDRGSAGYALSSLRPASPADPAPVAEARTLGYARSHDEVEPGAWGISVPIDPTVTGVDACIHVTTFRSEVAERAAPLALAATRTLEATLG